MKDKIINKIKELQKLNEKWISLVECGDDLIQYVNWFSLHNYFNCTLKNRDMFLRWESNNHQFYRDNYFVVVSMIYELIDEKIKERESK